MATSDEILQQVKRIKADFDTQVADINSRAYQADVEKAHLASEYLLASQKIGDLREQYDSARRRERTDHAQQAFGVGDIAPAGSDPMTRMVSYRDAQDRAEEAKGPEALLGLLRRAFNSGDAILARACAVHAFYTNRRDVLDEYDNHVPGWSELARQAREDQRNESLAATIRFRLKKPTPISALNDNDMRSLIERVTVELEKKPTGIRWAYL